MREKAVVLLIASMVALLLTASATASAQARPPIATILYSNISIREIIANSHTLIVAGENSSSATIIGLRFYNNTLLPTPHELFQLFTDKDLSLFTVDSITEPKLIGLAYADGTIDIYKVGSGVVTSFAVPEPPTRMAFLNRTLVVFTTFQGGTLYAIMPGKLGWYEARLRIGDLLPSRKEHLTPLSLYPVYNADGVLDYSGKAIVVAKVANTAIRTVELRGVIEVLNKNTTQPLSGTKLYVYLPAQGMVLSETVTGSNGNFSVKVPAGLNPTTQLYVSAYGRCYYFTLKHSMVTKTTTGYILSKPLLLNNATLAPSCPVSITQYRLLLAEPYNSTYTIRLKSFPVNVTSPKFDILTAFMHNNILYVVVSSPSIAIGPLALDAPSIVVLAFNATTLAPLYNLWRYYYTGGPALEATVSDDAGTLTVAVDNGVYYVLRLVNNTYELVWTSTVAGKPVGLAVLRSGNSYLLAAVSSSGNLALDRLAYAAQLFVPLARSDGKPYIVTGYKATGVALVNGTLAVGLSVGVLAVTGLPQATPITSIKQIMLSTSTLRVVDELGRPLKRFRVKYTLTLPYDGATLTLLKGMTEGLNGNAVVPCIPGGRLATNIVPLDKLHVPVYAAFTCNDAMLHVTVPLKRFNIKLTVLDSYNESVPLTSLNVTIVSRTYNYYTSFMYQGRPVILQLKPGVYNVTVTDPTGLYYYPYQGEIIVRANENVTIMVARKPADIIVEIGSDYTPTPNDVLNVQLVTRNGTRLYQTTVGAPIRGKPIKLDIKTLYRGPAGIIVEPRSPEKNYAPFYSMASKIISINGTKTYVYIKLVPKLYTLSVYVLDMKGNPINATITVYTNESKAPIAAAKNKAIAKFSLIRGRYLVSIEPTPIPNTTLRMYSIVKAWVSLLKGDTTFKAIVKKIREYVNITIRDPYSPNGQLIDNVIVYIDGSRYTVIPKGKVGKIRVPLLYKGSNFTLISENKRYPRYERKLLPSKKPLIILYKREFYKLTVYIVNDIGKPLPGATVTMTGINVKYAATTISNADGSAVYRLPLGEYEVCIKAAGYKPKCMTVNLLRNMQLSIVMTPLPLTIIMRYINIIAIIVFAIVMIVIIRLYFKKVLEKFATEEEF